MKKLLILLLSVCIVIALASCAYINLDGLFSSEPEELTVDSVYNLAVENGYEGTVEDFIEAFKGEKGADGENGRDGLGIKSVTVNSTGHLIIEYTDSSRVDAGLVIFTPDYERITPSIGTNGNWYIGGNDTGVPSNANDGSEWYTGSSVPSESIGFDGDFYISTSTLNVYYKDGTWGLVGSVKGGGGGGGEMSQVAISRALLSSVSIFCDLADGTGNYQTGSGVIYKLNKSSGDAYIITNHHVIYNDATSRIIDDSKMFIYLYGMEYESYAVPVSYVGGSATYDLAVLKVTASDIIKNSSVRSAVVADSDKVSVLDSVVAVGNPLGEGISATRGVVNLESEYVATQTSSSMRVMRVDVPVNEGNSGGGLFNTNGELVGIVDAKIIDEAVDNIGYVIPSNVAAAFVENILYYCDGNVIEKGRTVTFGIQVGVTDVTVRYDEQTEKLINQQTVSIQNVVSGSVAEQMGLSAGDEIISITVDGREHLITKVYHPVDIRLLMRPNITVTYKVDRGGTVMNKSVTLPSALYFTEID